MEMRKLGDRVANRVIRLAQCTIAAVGIRNDWPHSTPTRSRKGSTADNQHHIRLQLLERVDESALTESGALRAR